MGGAKEATGVLFQTLEVSHRAGEWLLWLPSSHNPVDGAPRRFPSLIELAGHAPRLLAEDLGGGQSGSDFQVTLVFSDVLNCPIGRRGFQRLRGVHRQHAPSWAEREVEHIFTVGYDGEDYVEI